MTDVQILGPTPAERDLESAIEDALDARSVPYSPNAALYVVDADAPAAIVRAMRELGWREPLTVSEHIEDRVVAAVRRAQEQFLGDLDGWRPTGLKALVDTTPLGDIADT